MWYRDIVLAGVSSVLIAWAQAKPETPTPMELQREKAISLCHAVNARVSGINYRCDSGKYVFTTPTNQPDYTIVSWRVQNQTEEILDIPLMLQTAEYPNQKARFVIYKPNLDDTLLENYGISQEKK